MENKGAGFLGIVATINGYHHFRVKPYIGIDLLLTAQREPLNSFDNNAIKIVVPPLSEIKMAL